MKRIMIVGQSGAGKSWLARRLGDRTGLPVIHLDRLHWSADWTPRDRTARDRDMLDAAHLPAWIIEGNYFATCHTRLARADTVIALDLPLPLRFARVLRRTATIYGRTRPDLAEGCREHVDLEFWRWIWESRADMRARMLSVVRAAEHADVHHLCSRREVRAFVSRFERGDDALSARAVRA